MKNLNEIDKAIVKSLSERLKFLANTNNAHFDEEKLKIKSENLQFNLSLVIAHIMKNLKFPDWSIEVFNQTISDFNSQHKTSLTFADFEDINWIRIIDKEVLLPAIVRNFIRKLGKDEQNRESVEVPIGKEDISCCLQLYYQEHLAVEKSYISKDALQTVLEKHAPKTVTADFLCDRNIIQYDENKEVYHWIESNQYGIYLNDQIAASLWLIICGEEAKEQDFRNYFRITRKSEIYFDSLQNYLNKANTDSMSELALSFIFSEKDLLNSENEFRKMWLDACGHSHIDIYAEIPKITFDYSSTFSFIQCIIQYRYCLTDVFNGGEIRGFTYPLLRIIAANAQLYPNPYLAILKILKDTGRPSLILQTYYLIKWAYPQIIPYLLIENELIPVAFHLLDEITFNNQILSGEIEREGKEEKRCEVRNQIWLEFFDFVLDSIMPHSAEKGEKAEAIAKVLVELSQKVFRNYSAWDTTTIIVHNGYRKLYDEALTKLREHRNRNTYYYSALTLHQRTIFITTPYIIGYLIAGLHEKDYPARNNFLVLKSGLVDVSIEIIRNSNIRYVDNELSGEEQESFTKSIDELITSLYTYLSRYYTQEKMEVISYENTGTTEMKLAKRGINEFGFEIIDWGYLYLHFEKNGWLDKFHDGFTNALNFDTTSDKYEDINKEQAEKIKLYFKALMLGFISINQKKDSYEIDGLPVNKTLDKAAQWIKELSFRYCVEDIKNKRVDAFEDGFGFGNNIYTQNLTTLLYESVNYFTDQQNDPFIYAFFDQDINLGKMLRAINILESVEYRDIISKRISSLKVEDFIDQSMLTTSIQNALVDAINSENHWELALPLIQKIENHYKRVKHRDNNIDNLIFEVNLLYAFKEKNYEKLLATKFSEREYRQIENKKTEELKQYYIALFEVYNKEDYAKGIKFLKRLHAKNNKDIRYAYHIYRAGTLLALKSKDDMYAFIAINQNWEKFTETLLEDEKKGLAKYEQAIAGNKLHYFAAVNDMDSFDRTVSILSKPFLYNEETIPTIYNFYPSRSLHVLAHNYIKSASEYLQSQHKSIPADIKSLIDNSETRLLLTDIKNAVGHVPALKATNIPLITPESINDKRNLSEFILHEFVDASKVMVEKIQGIKEVSGEDRYNDLFIAILKLRFQLWGWSIHDQARRGNSPTKKSAGETDLTIEAGNKTIALFEAFILRGKNKDVSQKHVLKTFDYAKNLDQYYMVIYFLGKQDQFENAWESYKEDVETCAFEPKYAFDTAKSFEDLSSLFDNINHLKVAKSIHGHNIEMYHMMIDLSE